jgi:hypothetical protein
VLALEGLPYAAPGSAHPWPRVTRQVVAAGVAIAAVLALTVSRQVALDHKTSQLSAMSARYHNEQKQAAAIGAELNSTKTQLAQVNSDLSTAQGRAADCQQAAAIGKQMVNLLAGAVVNIGGLLDAQSNGDDATAQSDATAVQTEMDRANALGPQFQSNLNTCTAGATTNNAV